MKLHIDFETRSQLDLKEVGLHRYARHPSTDVWCLAWAVGDDEPRIWTPGAPSSVPPTGLPVHAWNAAFELEIWNEILVKRYGFPVLKPEQTFCTMAQSYAMAMPGKLEEAAPAFGLETRKDNEGHALMMRMCRPRSKKGVTPVVWWDEQEKLERLYEYCKQDVRVERAVSARLMPLSDRERKIWLLDYKINQRGVRVDMASVNAAIDMAEVIKAQANEELQHITGGAVEGITKVAQLKVWMAERGVKVDSLAKQAIVDLLAVAEPEDEDDQAELGDVDVAADDTLPDDVRKALVLRQEVGKASAAKFNVMANRVGDDGRLRQLYQYHGAGPGRWAARGVQVHNLPRDMPKAETVEKILALVRAGDHRGIDMIYGPPLTMLSKCLRSFFVASPGNIILSGDWSNVEGRGQAWFAGEQWKLDAFVAADNKTGPGLYELAYARMFGVPVESVENPSEERQIGKVSELAFGYQGGLGSFRTMAKAYPDMRVQEMDDATIEGFKEAWRDAHPAIAGTRSPNYRGRRGGVWSAIQSAAISAVMMPDTPFTCGVQGRHAAYKMVGSFLWCLLPSGRAICYPYPKILEGDFGPQLTYMCVPSPEDRKKGNIIYDEANSHRFVRVATYGGSLFNNIVQGFCRDFLADGMIWLDERGADIVLHTHDDVNLEVHRAKAEGARVAMQDFMRTPPAWANGFPLFSKPAIVERYGK
jgi:DNA polymerase